MLILIIPVPITRHLSLHACLLTFASVPNQFDPRSLPKAENVRLAAWPQRHNNPSWLHEIALMHASKPDPQPRWRWVQCWDLAYALWSDVAHTISAYTLLLYSQGYAFQGFVKQRLPSVCASQWQTPDCSILPELEVCYVTARYYCRQAIEPFRSRRRFCDEPSMVCLT
jgi:hypothetical protein